ncbi:MAG: Crp/Fnr family transcriptional regulator [Bryobacteraceae bacterium]
MQSERNSHFEAKQILSAFGLSTSTIERQRNQIVYAQGDSADAIFYLQSGHVKLTVLSEEGKEAVVAILGTGDFFGETCLGGQARRNSSATAVTNCAITKIAKDEMLRALEAQRGFSEFFLSYVLSRNIHLEADLVDQLCNSCEKRLARILLLLTDSGQSVESARILPKINQETLAAMVGTTQPRISFLLNKFKEKGFIEYGHGLEVNSSLAEHVLRDKGCGEMNNSRN